MDSTTIIETERTVMRKLTTDDAKSFYLLNEDLDVLKYTGDVPFENIAAAKAFLKGYNQYELYGVGRFAAIEKETNDFIGWCGLKYSSELDEYDIGFRFYKKYWNRGFATETAKACIEYGFNKRSVNLVVGRAMLENLASIKVLEKIGMKFKQPFSFDGHDGVIYEKHCV